MRLNKGAALVMAGLLITGCGKADIPNTTPIGQDVPANAASESSSLEEESAAAASSEENTLTVMERLKALDVEPIDIFTFTDYTDSITDNNAHPEIPNVNNIRLNEDDTISPDGDFFYVNNYCCAANDSEHLYAFEEDENGNFIYAWNEDIPGMDKPDTAVIIYSIESPTWQLALLYNETQGIEGLQYDEENKTYYTSNVSQAVSLKLFEKYKDQLSLKNPLEIPTKKVKSSSYSFVAASEASSDAAAVSSTEE